MAVKIKSKLHPLFGAELEGASTHGAPSAEDRQAILDALVEYGLVLICGQNPTDAEMDSFARGLGPIWTISSTMLKNLDHINSATSAVYHYTNRAADGSLLGASDPGMDLLRINEFWHTDSTYSRPGSSISIFFGRICPPVGADTQFCDTRVAFAELPPDRQDALRSLTGEHSILHSLSRIGRGENVEGDDRPRYSAIERPLVRMHESGREALHIASHIGLISGMDSKQSEALLTELVDVAARPDRVYTHKWTNGDVLLWDNRCTMHRATPYQTDEFEREMWIIRLADESEIAEPAE